MYLLFFIWSLGFFKIIIFFSQWRKKPQNDNWEWIKVSMKPKLSLLRSWRHLQQKKFGNCKCQKWTVLKSVKLLQRKSKGLNGKIPFKNWCFKKLFSNPHFNVRFVSNWWLSRHYCNVVTLIALNALKS